MFGFLFYITKILILIAVIPLMLHVLIKLKALSYAHLNAPE